LWFLLSRRSTLVFGFLKPKDYDDLGFHIRRTNALLEKAHERFLRADRYLAGAGFGDQIVKTRAAQGAAARGVSALKEAFYNVEKAVQYSGRDPVKLHRVRVETSRFRDGDRSYGLATQDIRDNWRGVMASWYKQVDTMLGEQE
jgi:hypothetical protein